MTLTLKSIQQEAEDCRAAWAAMPDATHGWHIHHNEAIEPLSEPIANRIAYILSDKPEAEQALRLRLMRPARAEALKVYDAARAEARKVYDAARAEALKVYAAATAEAHRVGCPTADCPFDGKTIFPPEVPA